MNPATKAKNLLRTAAPGIYETLQGVVTDRRTKYLVRTITSESGWVVQDGPFKTMRYVPQAVGSTLVPKLLGSYEAELHPTLQTIIERNYKTIIDIGCAEGYYAVGLALKNSATKVHAFDIDDRAKQLCQNMAELNGVAARVVIESECTHQKLQALGGERCLIICDCEGCEFELLQPSHISNLKYCDLLVELHETIKPGVTNEMLDRFGQTHDISLVDSHERDPNDYPQLHRFSLLNQRVALVEFRDEGMQWAFMTAKSGSDAND